MTAPDPLPDGEPVYVVLRLTTEQQLLQLLDHPLLGHDPDFPRPDDLMRAVPTGNEQFLLRWAERLLHQRRLFDQRYHPLLRQLSPWDLCQDLLHCSHDDAQYVVDHAELWERLGGGSADDIIDLVRDAELWETLGAGSAPVRHAAGEM